MKACIQVCALVKPMKACIKVCALAKTHESVHTGVCFSKTHDLRFLDMKMCVSLNPFIICTRNCHRFVDVLEMVECGKVPL